MTHERREEVVLVALIVSVAVHVGLMLLVRSQRMTMTTAIADRTRREPMKLVKREILPSPTTIGEIVEIEPVRKGVEARADRPIVEAPSASSLPSSSPLPERTSSPEDEKLFAPSPLPFAFDPERGQDNSPLSVMPVLESPKAEVDMSRPKFTAELPGADGLTSGPRPETMLRNVGSPIDAGRSTLSQAVNPAPPSLPTTAEVYSHVDTLTVEKEKQAVRILVDSPDAADLDEVVEVALSTCVKGGWRYFRVKMLPKPTLGIVPKDVVVLLDGSGSIGNDRLASCRNATRRILRSCTNTGDRFNLVVFRNAFSYAFNHWQECDADGFNRADDWLSRQSSHGRTDVFSTIASVLTLPRDPKRPIIALVVTDGDANEGVSDTADIIALFTALNDGLVSVYMYGVKTSANRELIDVLTHGNRGESLIFNGLRWSSGSDVDKLSERFRDPVLSDLRIVFSMVSEAEAYPRLLKNIYRGGALEFVGRLPMSADRVAFSLRGQSSGRAFESFFSLRFEDAPIDPVIEENWKHEHSVDLKLMQ